MRNRIQHQRIVANWSGVTAPAFIAFFAAMLSAGAWSQNPGSSPQQNKIVNDFGTRISEYLALRQKETGAPTKSSNSSRKLLEQQKQAAAKIQAARATAKQGDIFTPEITEYFKYQIASAMAGEHGKKVRLSLRHSEPVHGLTLRVNDTYPHGVPLQSMPASLLQRLPVLPQELEYRIVGHDLALHDIEPNMIVDFIPNAIPTG
jgi:hypothetical protein